LLAVEGMAVEVDAVVSVVVVVSVDAVVDGVVLLYVVVDVVDGATGSAAGAGGGVIVDSSVVVVVVCGTAAPVVVVEVVASPFDRICLASSTPCSLRVKSMESDSPSVKVRLPTVDASSLKWVKPVAVRSTTSSSLKDTTVPVAVRPGSSECVGTEGLVRVSDGCCVFVRLSWLVVVAGCVVSVVVVVVDEGCALYCAHTGTAIRANAAAMARTTFFMSSASLTKLSTATHLTTQFRVVRACAAKRLSKARAGVNRPARSTALTPERQPAGAPACPRKIGGVTFMNRSVTMLALGLLLVIPVSLKASAPHHSMPMAKVDYDPEPGGGDPNPPAACNGAPFKVTISGGATSFSPSTITIDAGQAVCWNWSTGGISHNVKADDDSFSSGSPASSGTFQRTFNTPGTYGYFCQVHGALNGGMRGTVVVRETGGGDDGGGDDSGPGTLSFDPTSVTVDENGGPATLTVTRTGGSAGKVTVRLSTSGGNASKGKDYVPVTNRTLTWNAGDDDPKTVNVTVKNDSLLEPDETFNAALSKVTGGAATGSTVATVTIHDDDTPQCPASQAAPASVKATGRTGEVGLSWTDDGAATTAVHVERRALGGAFQEVGVVDAGVGRFVDLGLPAGTTFLYRLRSEGAGGLSDWSEVVAGATDASAGACASEAGSVCLGGGQFEARATFRAEDGAALRGAWPRSDGGSRSALFAWASGGDPELMLSVQDGCAVNGHRWVLLGATTDAELVVTLRDTRTGRTWAFYNPPGKMASGVRDVDAFGCQ
jgi:plastocyanin